MQLLLFTQLYFQSLSDWRSIGKKPFKLNGTGTTEGPISSNRVNSIKGKKEIDWKQAWFDWTNLIGKHIGKGSFYYSSLVVVIQTWKEHGL